MSKHRDAIADFRAKCLNALKKHYRIARFRVHDENPVYKESVECAFVNDHVGLHFTLDWRERGVHLAIGPKVNDEFPPPAYWGSWRDIDVEYAIDNEFVRDHHGRWAIQQQLRELIGVVKAHLGQLVELGDLAQWEWLKQRARVIRVRQFRETDDPRDPEIHFVV
jgi:hypothetical protein